jgi:hypothetical protein
MIFNVTEVVRKGSTNLGKHSVLNDAKFFFNEIPKEIGESERISVFKNKLKYYYYLIEQQDKKVCKKCSKLC